MKNSFRISYWIPFSWFPISHFYLNGPEFKTFCLSLIAFCPLLYVFLTRLTNLEGEDAERSVWNKTCNILIYFLSLLQKSSNCFDFIHFEEAAQLQRQLRTFACLASHFQIRISLKLQAFFFSNSEIINSPVLVIFRIHKKGIQETGWAKITIRDSYPQSLGLIKKNTRNRLDKNIYQGFLSIIQGPTNYSYQIRPITIFFF